MVPLHAELAMHDHERASILAGTLQDRLAKVTFPIEAAAEREVRRLVCEYADELRELDFPPEQVILAVKRAANDAGLSYKMRFDSRPAVDGKDKLLADIVRWCIDRYYLTPDQYDQA
jgi:hypothetical protein